MSTIQLKTAVPGPRSRELSERQKKSVARGVPQLAPIYVKSAKDASITDVDGNVFLDFYGGIGCINAGHTQSSVVAAIQKQAEEFLHTCFMVAPYEGYIALAEELNKLAPGKSEKRSMFVNSGAEAVENGLKIARSYTGRPGILCFDDAYHGRTYMAMSVTAKEKPYKYGFGPFSEDVYRVPFANAYRMENAAETCLAAIEETFKTKIPADHVAAILFEPIQGEGGFIVPSKEFVQGLRAICDKYGIVLIADEVQTGYCRTGKTFACEHFDLEPDILLSAKSIASGMPLAAVTGKAAIMDQPGPGAVGGTFGGNPLSCAAALATLKLYQDGSLAARAEEIGKIFVARARKMKEEFACIGDIRGLGGMQAIELVTDQTSKAPAKELTGKIAHFAMEHGLLLVTAGTYGNVLRLLVPLVASDEQIHEGMDVIEAAMASLVGESA